MPDALQPDLLADDHVVVTGGGTGLGRAMALRFADLGAAVTINGRRPDPLAETVADIEDTGGTAEGIQCNVRDPEAVQAFFEEAEERQGPVTRLVNNAAANFLAPTEDVSPNGFDAIVRTNLYGSFYCTQACGRRWLRRETDGVVLHRHHLRRDGQRVRGAQCHVGGRDCRHDPLAGGRVGQRGHSPQRRGAGSLQRRGRGTGSCPTRTWHSRCGIGSRWAASARPTSWLTWRASSLAT